MSAIEVTGKWVFEESSCRFVFADGQQIDMTPLLSGGEARTRLLAILGQGYAQFERQLSPRVKVPERTDPLSEVQKSVDTFQREQAEALDRINSQFKGPINVDHPSPPG